MALRDAGAGSPAANAAQARLLPHAGGPLAHWVHVQVRAAAPLPRVHPLRVAAVVAAGHAHDAVPLTRTGRRVAAGVLWLPPQTVALALRPVQAPAAAIASAAVAVRTVAPAAALAHAFAGATRLLAAQPHRLAHISARAARRTLRSAGLAAAVEVLQDVGADYADWVARYDTRDASERARWRAWAAALPAPPQISVLMPVYNPPERFLRRAIESVRAQLYPHWQLCIADDCSTAAHVCRVCAEYAALDARICVRRMPRNGHICAASNAALAAATGEFVALLDHDDELAEHALATVAAALVARPGLGLVFSDEDKIDAAGRRCDPYFKGALDRELLRCQNMVSHLGVYRRALVQRLGGFTAGTEGSQDHDLALRVSEHLRADEVQHLPHVLYHWRTLPGSTATRGSAKPYARVSAMRAVAAHLRRCGEVATVGAARVPGYLRVRHALPLPPPTVSIVVRLAPGPRAARRQVAALLARTAGAGLQWVWVHDAAAVPPPAALGARHGIAPGAWRSVALPRGAAPTDWAAAGVAAARGDCVALLAAAARPRRPDWLCELLRHAARPGIGVVGPRLLDGQGRSLGAGLVLGTGLLASPLLAGAPAHGHGYFGRGRLTQSVAALPLVCWVLRREHLVAAAGLRADMGPHAPLDLCLRLTAQGLRHLCVAEGDMHVATQPAAISPTPEHTARMRAAWGETLTHDSSYSPNLATGSAACRLAFPPGLPLH